MLKAAQAEVQRLEAELAKTVAFQKLEAARRIVELYKNPESGGAAKQAATPFPESRELPRSHTKTAQIEKACVDYLRDKGARATSGELLEPVEKAGITIGGVRPLASFLSNSTVLNNVRDLGGYGLVEWTTGAGPKANGHS
jgi:hypothetical protein